MHYVIIMVGTLVYCRAVVDGMLRNPTEHASVDCAMQHVRGGNNHQDVAVGLVQEQSNGLWKSSLTHTAGNGFPECIATDLVNVEDAEVLAAAGL